MRRSRPESPELALLEQAMHLLHNASQPEEALQPLVSLVKQQMGTDVCSLYLLEPGGPELVLMASDGLASTAIGRVRMHLGEGLTGLVAEVRAPVSVPEAARHPRFRYFPETGEERYHSFLGVPLLRRGEVVGVLVVQTREARRFRRDEVRVLSAMATQLAAALGDAVQRKRPPAIDLPRRYVFPAVAAEVRSADEVALALEGRPQALYAHAELGAEVLRGICDAAAGSMVLVACEEAEVELLAGLLRDVPRRSPLRLAVGGVTEPAEMERARRAVVRTAPAADVALGVAVDAAGAALSVRALSAQGDFFLVDTTALARSATGGRCDDPFLPAVLRLVARALHAARESGRPTFLAGGLASSPEGWLAAAGYGADVVIAPAAQLGRLRRFGRRLAPGIAAQAARAALRAGSAAAARSVLIAEAAPDS